MLKKIWTKPHIEPTKMLTLHQVLHNKDSNVFDFHINIHTSFKILSASHKILNDKVLRLQDITQRKKQAQKLQMHKAHAFFTSRATQIAKTPHKFIDHARDPSETITRINTTFANAAHRDTQHYNEVRRRAKIVETIIYDRKEREITARRQFALKIRG
ncbi:MAG: hypothetical protein COB76_04540 [Alphaproteobacteria bacterium]|nr:MAG: hypothetical protein COB76_04540 [Alphaproteobacteria bacterium]